MRILKALFTSSLASLLDFGLTVLLSSLFGMYYVMATALGAVAGGIANCVLNYRWVFPDCESRKVLVAVKYAFMWVVSIGLNTLGTYLMTEWLRGEHWAHVLLHTHSDQLYIVSKIIVAILVATAWNYQMQRYFVYRDFRWVGRGR